MRRLDWNDLIESADCSHGQGRVQRPLEVPRVYSSTISPYVDSRPRSCCSSSTVISTSRGLEPSEGPTTPRSSSWSMIRLAREKPTFIFDWSMEVDPSPE